ncbi:uncharacterized protein DUF1254 [Phyllobacterium brassicacearum]|nr:uncharacterized protein DUF1254 [Phyllobacterium brassicacearum]
MKRLTLMKGATTFSSGSISTLYYRKSRIPADRDEGCTYLFAGPDWMGEPPEGIDQVFRSETDFVGTLTRTGINGTADIPKVREVQRGYRFTPLSAFMAEKPPAPAPELDFPVWHEELAKSPAYWISEFPAWSREAKSGRHGCAEAVCRHWYRRWQAF